MNEEQIALLELIELLLSHVSEDPEYRHLRVRIGDDKVFMEDTVMAVLLSTKRHSVIIDMERAHNGNTIMGWNEPAAAEMMTTLKHYYILEMMAGI